MNPYTLEHIFSYRGTLASPPEAIGEMPEGIRVNFYSTGGEITGPKVHGQLKPVGGDWMTVRKDGTALMDVRTTFQTEDDALILVTYRGIADLGEGGYEHFLKGELPAIVKLRMSPWFVTNHSKYAWLNRLHCLGIGEYRAATNDAHYDVYAVR